jgi:5-methylcytosine-specific restriction endonuclease McrA
MKAKPRPKRRAIPMRVKRAVCERQLYLCRRCGIVSVHWERQVIPTNFDHEPALRLRKINRAGTDYIPPQHSVDHIDALCKFCHDKKTRGSGATTAGTDVGKIAKERKRAKAIAISMTLQKDGNAYSFSVPLTKMSRFVRLKMKRDKFVIEHSPTARFKPSKTKSLGPIPLVKLKRKWPKQLDPWRKKHGLRKPHGRPRRPFAR